MPRKRTPHTSTADATYELVLAPVSGTPVRTPVSSAEIAALIDGDCIVVTNENGERYSVELVALDASDEDHHGRTRTRVSATQPLPVHEEEARDWAGGLG